jgi:serine/threonine protein kinase
MSNGRNTMSPKIRRSWAGLDEAERRHSSPIKANFVKLRDKNVKSSPLNGVIPESPEEQLANNNMSNKDKSTPNVFRTPLKHSPEVTRLKNAFASRHRRRSSVSMGSPMPAPLVNQDMDQFYNLLGRLGEGATSHVYLASDKKTSNKVAIKVIKKELIINHHELAHEVGILKKCRHPNIIGLIDVFITQTHLQIVMELCEGQELFDEIVQRRTFTESDAKNIIREVLSAVKYLHEQGIAHRDIKPENIMFTKSGETQSLKLVDFGFAQTLKDEAAYQTPAGTLGYKAPEIIKKEPYSTKADIWAIGVITYILLCGFPPFFSYDDYTDANMLLNAPFWYFFNEETESLFNQIKLGAVTFPEPFWKDISEDAKNFVLALLKVSPHERLTAEQALTHEWMTRNTPPKNQGVETKKLMARFKDSLRQTKEIPAIARPKTPDLIERHILSYTHTDDEIKRDLFDMECLHNQQMYLSQIDRTHLKKYILERKSSVDSLLKFRDRVQRKPERRKSLEV